MVTVQQRKGPFYWKDSGGGFGVVDTLAELTELTEINRVEYLQLKEVFAENQVTDAREPMKEREIEICMAINAVLCGAGNIVSADDVKELLTAANHTVADMVGLLTEDFTAVEPLHSPTLSDSEIRHLTIDRLEQWIDDVEERRDALSDGIEEWRQFEANLVAEKELLKPELAPVRSEDTGAISYRQLLTIAALQGLCANPAHATSFDDIPGMASDLADAVVRIQGRANGQ